MNPPKQLGCAPLQHSALAGSPLEILLTQRMCEELAEGKRIRLGKVILINLDADTRWMGDEIKDR
jgi:hypothetical protein